MPSLRPGIASPQAGTSSVPASIWSLQVDIWSKQADTQLILPGTESLKEDRPFLAQYTEWARVDILTVSAGTLSLQQDIQSLPEDILSAQPDTVLLRAGM